MTEKSKQRLSSFITFAVLFAVEVIIALFVDDRILRPFGGDVIVVWVVYCFVRIFIPDKIKLLPLWVFLFAVCVEVLQYVNIIGLLGLSDSRIASTVLGTSFSFIDIGCYALGCAVLLILTKRKRSSIN